MDCWHRQFQLVFLLSSRHSTTTVTLTTALRCRCHMRFFTCLSIALKAQLRTLLSTARSEALGRLVLCCCCSIQPKRAGQLIMSEVSYRLVHCSKLQPRTLTPPCFCDEISCRRRRAQGPSQLPEEGEHATLRNTRCGRATPPSPLPRTLRKKNW